jgi:hypothetical protein
MGMDSSKKTDTDPMAGSHGVVVGNSPGGIEDVSGALAIPPPPAIPPPAVPEPPHAPVSAPSDECPLGVPIVTTTPPTPKTKMVVSDGIVTWVEDIITLSDDAKAVLEKAAKEKEAAEAALKAEIVSSFVPVPIVPPDTNITSPPVSDDMIAKFNEQAVELKNAEDKKKAEEKARLERIAKYQHPTYGGYSGYGGYGGYNPHNYYNTRYGSPPSPPNHLAQRKQTTYHGSDDESDDEKKDPEQVLRDMAHDVDTLRVNNARMLSTMLGLQSEVKTLSADLKVAREDLNIMRTMFASINLKLNRIQAAVAPAATPPAVNPNLSADAIQARISN